MSEAPPYSIKMSIQRLVCTGCGAEANASCNCGKPYVPKAERAAKAIKATPEKSSRAIAEEIGVSPATVDRARAGASCEAPAAEDTKDTDAGGPSEPLAAAVPEPATKPDHWKGALRRYIEEQAGQPFKANDLFNKFGIDMPLHHATRLWAQAHKGTLDDDMTNEDMRWYAFRKYLRSLDLQYALQCEPPLSRNTPLTRNTMVIGRTRPPTRTGIDGKQYSVKPQAEQKSKAKAKPKPRLPQGLTFSAKALPKQIAEGLYDQLGPETAAQVCAALLDIIKAKAGRATDE